MPCSSGQMVVELSTTTISMNDDVSTTWAYDSLHDGEPYSHDAVAGRSRAGRLARLPRYERQSEWPAEQADAPREPTPQLSFCGPYPSYRARAQPDAGP